VRLAPLPPIAPGPVGRPAPASGDNLLNFVAAMGLFSSLSSSSLLSSGTAASSRSPSSSGSSSSARRRPETDEEMEEVIARMRSAFKDPDTVERQLTVGGEEGLTDAQLRR
jgi:hypothetical protein